MLENAELLEWGSRCENAFHERNRVIDKMHAQAHKLQEEVKRLTMDQLERAVMSAEINLKFQSDIDGLPANETDLAAAVAELEAARKALEDFNQ